MEKYFLKDLQRRKKVEFLNFHQGTMFVGEYWKKFDELSKFCPCFHNIKQTVSYLEISSFSTLVNRCRIYDDDTKARQAQ